MTNEEFLLLKDGSTLTYNGSRNHVYADLSKGAVITRESNWMDCDSSIAFSYVDDNGFKDFHFFRLDDIQE